MASFDYNSTVLAVLNQKGGVGKTTVASIIAEYAAINGDGDVLVVDLDMQCNSSDFWVGMEASATSAAGQLPPRHPDYDGDPGMEERSSIADIFYGKAVLPHPTFMNTDAGFKNGVDIMVGHPVLLDEINNEYDSASGKIATEIVNRLGEFLHLPDVADAYSLIILDTGPSRSPIFRAAVKAATHVVIPFEPEEKSLQGINSMLQVVKSENYGRSNDDPLSLIGLCPNKVRSTTNLHKSTLGALHERMPSLMFPEEVFLPQSTAFPERDIKGINPKSIYQIAKSHTARLQSEVVGDYVMGKIFN